MPGGAALVRGVMLGGGPQGEEARTAPGGAGNGARDRRKAGIGLTFPDIAVALDRDGMAPAAIVADQHGPDLKIALGSGGAAGKAVQESEAGTVEGAERLLLNFCSRSSQSAAS